MIVFQARGLERVWPGVGLSSPPRRAVGLVSQEGDAVPCAHHSVRDLDMYYLGKVTTLNLELSRGLPSPRD